MVNPWMKKNPLMSAWLSAANRAASQLRGQASAQVKRQLSAAVAQATKDHLVIWTGLISPPKAKARRKPRKAGLRAQPNNIR